MNSRREEFGRRLRAEREARGLSISELANRTKIPERSLGLLERGRFDDLPADVFVRGFVKSVTRELGLDADEWVRRYADLSRQLEGPGARLSDDADAGRDISAPSAGGGGGGGVGGGGGDATPDGDELGALARSLLGAGRGARRASLTVAVVILVIVATVTLSLLLQRPGHVGDGVSALPAPTARAG